MRESITISIRPTSPFTCAPAVFNLFHTDHHQIINVWPALAAKRLVVFLFSITNKSLFASALFFFHCRQRPRRPGRGQLDEIVCPPDYWEKEALKYFRFSSILMMPADRCSKRRLPGLVSSLYSRQLTHPHYITIRLPLKVILPEHNHTQSKPQTSYITETVNSPRVYFLLPQKSFCSGREMRTEWLWFRSTSFFWFKIK